MNLSTPHYLEQYHANTRHSLTKTQDFSAEYCNPAEKLPSMYPDFAIHVFSVLTGLLLLISDYHLCSIPCRTYHFVIRQLYDLIFTLRSHFIRVY